VVIYMLKIVTLLSLTPHVWMNDSFVWCSLNSLLTLVIVAFTPAAGGRDEDFH